MGWHGFCKKTDGWLNFGRRLCSRLLKKSCLFKAAFLFFLQIKPASEYIFQTEAQRPLPRKEVIHIAQVVIGPTACRSEALLVKSILRYYYTAHGRGGGLHFHIISDADSTAILRTLFTSWSLPNVEVTFYQEEHFHVSRLVSIFQKYEFSSANICSLFILACVG